MRIADLCCGAGGAAMGLHRAFPDAEIVGYDIVTQPRYPFKFVQQDALTVDLTDFDFVWASPPCQEYTTVSGRAKKGKRNKYPDLIQPMRERLEHWGGAWIMENVPGAPLHAIVMLCGSMFGLDVRRHRFFETPFAVLSPPCTHDDWTPRYRSLDSRQKTLARVIGVHGHLNYPGEQDLRAAAMGIDWMNVRELTQAIPPAYSQYLAQFIPLPVELEAA